MRRVLSGLVNFTLRCIRLITIVAAMTKERVIGNGNGLPWHIPEEIRHYRAIIEGKIVIMGGKTYELMKKNLPGRNNIVISRALTSIDGIDLCTDINSALKKAASYGDDIFIIGGASVFEQTIGIADRMSLSEIKKSYEGDKFFPEFSKENWTVESREDFAEFEYVVYARKRL